jgi:hypothetical protein
MTRPHRALVVTTAAAARDDVNGARLRVDDVTASLEVAGFAVTRSTHLLPPGDRPWCVGVAVSYASAGAVRGLRRVAPRVWLDAMDSWLLVNGSGIAHGHASYAARAARDAVRLLWQPRADLVTYISLADARADRGTVRGTTRLVLPGHVEAPTPLPRLSGGRRLVVVGDWGYLPNRDGLRWLRDRVLPLMTWPLRIDVYGLGGEAFYGHPALALHGYVPDPMELYREGDVHLAPVRFGGGVKRKVLQPLVAGLPVVATPASAHGLASHNLLDICSTPAAFARAMRARLESETGPPVPPQPGDVLDADDRPAVQAWLTKVPCGCAV